MRTRRITKALQAHDLMLYCAKQNGVMCVFRKSHKWVTQRLSDSEYLRVLCFSPHFIFALTDNWRTTGVPCDWGIEPIMAKIRAGDLQHRDDLVAQFEKINEDIDRREENYRKGEAEAFASDVRSEFKKLGDNLNLSTVAKKDSRRDQEKRLRGK